MTDTGARRHVDWRSWGEAAFAEAAERDVPVLLSLVTEWCRDCRRMDEETFGEPRIAANVEDRFVPVRVTADRRPRVRERYAMGGFPTTAFLTPTGELLTGATYLGADGFRQVLDAVAEMWADRGAEAGRVPRSLTDDPTPAGAVTPAIEEHFAGQLAEQYDDDHAGWGTATKFPLPETIDFALKRDRDRALRSLDAVHDHLSDDVAGGFFRYASRRDWGDVHHAKTLPTNAALVRTFAHAYCATGEERYRDAAADTVAFLAETLWTGEGFGAGQGPATGAEYFERDAAERAAADVDPRRDLVVDAGPNALAAEALLTLFAYTDDERPLEYARRTLDTLAARHVDDDGRVWRFVEDDADDDAADPPTDALADSSRVVAAFATRAQVTGEGLATATAVADRALAVLGTETGALRDGPATGAGLLDRPLRPLDDNVALAAALLDLAVLTGEPHYRSAARELIAAFADATTRFGAQVAGYGNVAARLCHGDLVVAVGDDVGSDLHRAALRVADHEKVVVPSAHDRSRHVDADGTVLGDDVAVEPGTARVVVDGDVTEPATGPDELMRRVSEHSV